MSVKLFGNSRAPRLQKDVKKKTKTKTKRTVLDRIIADYRTRFIATAMETMRHRWLATAFFPPAVVKAVTDQMAATQEAQIGVNSEWNKGTKLDEAAKAAADEEEEENPEDQEIEAVLKKAQERSDEHEAEKKARMRKAPLPPNERDW